MQYTYMGLSKSWGLVKCENIINWVDDRVDVSYAFCKSSLIHRLDIDAFVAFIQRINNSFNQDFRQLANRYYDNLNSGDVKIGKDSDKEMDQYVDSNSYTTFRINIVRLIINKDPLYVNNNDLYAGISKIKSIKREDLYKFAQQIEKDDISTIIDHILYVFLVKGDNKIKDIKSTKFLGMITKTFPTQVDRCIQGKPIIIPMSKKYKVNENIIKGYVSLIATYVMNRADVANE